eukprot:3605251-Prymnesium_polylepis.2
MRSARPAANNVRVGASHHNELILERARPAATILTIPPVSLVAIPQLQHRLRQRADPDGMLYDVRISRVGERAQASHKCVAQLACIADFDHARA